MGGRAARRRMIQPGGPGGCALKVLLLFFNVTPGAGSYVNVSYCPVPVGGVMTDTIQRTVMLNGHEFSYLDSGDGPALLFIHGLTGSCLLYTSDAADDL